MILASSLDSSNGNIFLLNGLWVYKVYCDTCNFTASKFKQLLERQNLLWERSLQASTIFLAYWQQHHKQENLKTYEGILLFWGTEKLTLALIWLRDYRSKCDVVATCDYQKIATWKNTFNCFWAARVKIC